LSGLRKSVQEEYIACYLLNFEYQSDFGTEGGSKLHWHLRYNIWRMAHEGPQCIAKL